MIQYFPIIIELINKYWLPSSVISILIAFICYLLKVLLDENLSAAWRARIYKAVFKISGKSGAERKYIENDINSRINIARRSMPFGKEYLPKAIKVEWFEGGEGETAHINENEIVVRLDPINSQEKNVIMLVDAWVKQTSLIGIRHILKEPLELSMDMNLIKNLLKEVGDRRVLDWFFRNEYQPSIDKTDDIKKWNAKIVEIDERGLFTRLLLVELDEYSKRIMGKTPSSEMFDEIAGLIDFLYKITTKFYGEIVPLEYTTRNIKIGVILVGETEKVIYEIEKYLIAFAYKMERQLTSIYLVVWDKDFLGSFDSKVHEKFVKMTENLEEGIQRTFRVPKDFELKYSFTDKKGNKRKSKISRYIPEYISQ